MRNQHPFGPRTPDPDLAYFNQMPKPRKPLLRLPSKEELAEAKRRGYNPVLIEVSEISVGAVQRKYIMAEQAEQHQELLRELKAQAAPRTTAEQLADYNARRRNINGGF